MKTIKIKVIPKAKQNKIVKEGERLKVYLTAPPTKGKANQALIKLLSKHYKLPKSRIRIVKGERLREKVVEMDI